MDAVSDLIKNQLGKTNSEVEQLFADAGMEVETPKNEEAIIIEDSLLPNLKDESVEKLSQLKIIWAEQNRKLIAHSKIGDMSKVKISCVRCLKMDFPDLTSPPLFEDYQTMNFVKKHLNYKIKEKSGGSVKIKTLVGEDYLFKCEVCGGGATIAVETE